MTHQTQGLQSAAALLRRPSPLQHHHREGLGAATRKPVLETDEFRVVEPDGTEDPWASADDGVVPERPARDGGGDNHRSHRQDD